MGPRLRSEAGANLVVDERTLWPAARFTTTVVVVRKAFAAAHPDAVRSLVRAHGQTVAWIHANPVEAKASRTGELKRLTGKALNPAVLNQAWPGSTLQPTLRRRAFVAFPPRPPTLSTILRSGPPTCPDSSQPSRERWRNGSLEQARCPKPLQRLWRRPARPGKRFFSMQPAESS